MEYATRQPVHHASTGSAGPDQTLRHHTFRSLRFLLGAVVAICMLLGIVGCGGEGGPERVVVQGEATYEGTPISNGQIYFYPDSNTQGPVSGGPIKDGRYVAKARGGVPVGSHRVEITGYRRPARASSGGSEEGMPPEQYVPAKYNIQSELTAIVEGTSNPTIQDFHLN